MSALGRRPRPGRLVTGALLLDAGATLPAALTGAVTVAIRSDLDLTDQQLGAALSLCFLGGALVSLLMQRTLDPLGWRRAALLGSALVTISLVGVAVARGGLGFTLALLVGGAAVAIVMPASNLLLVSVDGSERLATLLAAKQASVPLALLLAGLAVPLVVTAAGWRAAFVLAALVAPGGLALVWGLGATSRGGRSARATSPPGTQVEDRRRRRAKQPDDGRSGGLASAAVGVALGACLPGALTAYLVISLTESGLDPTAAAVLYGSANAGGILVRLAGGSFAQRTATDGFAPVAVLMILGGIGAVLLGTELLPLLVLGSVLAFSLGWGWPGLLFYAVMKARPDAPAAATAIVQAGGLGGAALGPLVAGWVVGQAGWTVTWMVIGGLAVLGGTIVLRQRGPRR